MTTILMMSTKTATLLSLLKIKIKMFQNKDYDLIISSHDVTYKIL